MIAIEKILDNIEQLPPLESLDTDEELRRTLFPCVENGVFLAHAGVAPISGLAAAELRRKSHYWSRGFSQSDYEQEVKRAREAAALLCGVLPEEVALLGPTSLGLSLVALGLDWEKGDEIIINSRDYPANVYIWRDLERRGVVVREIAPPVSGEICKKEVESLLSSGRVKLVALASAHFLSGTLLDTFELSKISHVAGAYFCLDGIQTLGAVRTPLDHVDFCSADSHKWLLGPVGAGIFIVKKQHQETLRPALLGAENVRTRHFVPAEKIEWVHGAARYEPGVLNIPGIAAMRASMDMLNHWGIPAVETRLTELKKYTHTLLIELGCEFLGKNPNTQPGGILTFRHPDFRSAALHLALQKEGFITSMRWTPEGEEWIRISPHVCNTKTEMRLFAECCSEAMRNL